MNDGCFFIIFEKKLICWNYRSHKQYELTLAHAQRLIFLAYNPDKTDKNNPLDSELKSSGILDSTPYNSWGWDILSHIFHFGTKNIPLDFQPGDKSEWAAHYLEHCEDISNKEIPTISQGQNIKDTVSLPRSLKLSTVESTLKLRSTSRVFSDHPVQRNIFARLLESSLSFNAERKLPDTAGIAEMFRNRRSSPSGGGLNATEAYVYVHNIEGIKRGIYYYNPTEHCLHLTSSELPALGNLLSGQHFADDLALGFFLTSRLDKLWWKYEHSRAYRNALLEIGHVAQTLQIAATSLGLGTWPTGALNENLIDPLLGIKDSDEQVFFFVGCGYTD
ncbi:SagB/ThcOx family dehydrogenase, partial [Pseudomonas sp. SWRI107]